ncbi:MAG: branched-chain amino acid aminotransferase, partial [Pseudomonadota bacterium]
MADWSETRTWIDGAWHEGNVPVIGPRTHAFWLGSSVFDGARAYDGLLPDIDAHCARVNRSASALGLEPTMAPEEIASLARDGVAQFHENTALYIRPMYWAEAGGYKSVPADPASTRFLLCLHAAPMPPAGAAERLALTPFRRPTLDCMPTDAKAGCLYPNNGRAIMHAKERGFDSALVLDALGNVAETATSNIFIVRDAEVITPIPNGCFLAGITRSRTMSLLRDVGYTVTERVVTVDDVRAADEAFTTGNYAKVTPIVGFEDVTFPIGPVSAKARELYTTWAQGTQRGG